MIRIDETYAEFFDDTDEHYPAGKAIDVSGEDQFDGTPYLARWMNDVIGFGPALFKETFGGLAGISNNPDNADVSDRLDAIKVIAQKEFRKHLHTVECYDAESVFDWADLGITFDADKQYFAVGYLPTEIADFLRIDCKCKSDGLHVKIMLLSGGSQIAFLDYATWNSFIWGAPGHKWGEKARTKVNVLISEVG